MCATHHSSQEDRKTPSASQIKHIHAVGHNALEHGNWRRGTPKITVIIKAGKSPTYSLTSHRLHLRFLITMALVRNIFFHICFSANNRARRTGLPLHDGNACLATETIGPSYWVRGENQLLSCQKCLVPTPAQKKQSANEHEFKRKYNILSPGWHHIASNEQHCEQTNRIKCAVK